MYRPKYFTLDELTRSTVAQRRHINNVPGSVAICNLYDLMQYVLDPIRELWNRPITVTSAYRSTLLNKAVGGATNSSHIRGQAADITVGDKNANFALYKMIKASDVPYTKMIFERNNNGAYWIHISYCKDLRGAHKCYIFNPLTKTYNKDE